MRLVPFLALLLLPAVTAQTPPATGTLQGVVLDEHGETLPGANVLVEGTVQRTVLGAATNVNGLYRIVGVPAGTYTVTASFAGFDSETVGSVELVAGRTTQIGFTLGTPEFSLEGCYPSPPMRFSVDPFTSRVISGEELVLLPVR